MPDEIKADVEKERSITGWILFGIAALILYTMFVYDKGLSKGMSLSQKSFYIEHYHGDPVYGLDEGMNAIPSSGEVKPETKPVKKHKRS